MLLREEMSLRAGAFSFCLFSLYESAGFDNFHVALELFRASKTIVAVYILKESEILQLFDRAGYRNSAYAEHVCHALLTYFFTYQYFSIVIRTGLFGEFQQHIADFPCDVEIVSFAEPPPRFCQFSAGDFENPQSKFVIAYQFLIKYFLRNPKKPAFCHSDECQIRHMA